MRRALTTGVVLLVFALVGWGGYVYEARPGAPRSEGAAPPIPVTAGVAETRDMPVYVRGIGSVQAFNTVTVKSRVDGQIVKVDFVEGQEVKAGDLLFEIDPRPFEAALAQAIANQQRDQAQLVSAQADLRRDEELLAHGNQTRQAYDQQKALVGQVQAAIRADQAQIDTAQLNLQYAEIRSPIDGRTGARLVDIGNIVHAADNTALLTITQLKPIFVSFTAPQQDLDTIRDSQSRTGAVAVQALSQSDEHELAIGKLSLIDNQVDAATGTIHLKATFANEDERLWPGEFVNTRLVVGVRKDAVTVATRAVQRGPNGSYLFVIKPDSTVEMRNIEVADVEEGLAVIDKGLSAGETIVDDGQYRLDSGARVTVQSPAPSPAG